MEASRSGAGQIEEHQNGISIWLFVKQPTP
jgi:hypothetical protein